MKFAIITHVSHGKKKGTYFGYGPYVREMNIWLKYVDEVIIVAPLELELSTNIELDYQHANIEFRNVKSFNLNTTASILKSILAIPSIAIEIFIAMKNADHIHLRCPGNIGLLGCFVQILFPNKKKTAKYAGNWDPKAKQPLSYRLQKWILGNTFLTKNMQVLVYGEWPGQTKNIKPFFTATYFDKEKKALAKKQLENINFLFVGTLSEGKRPLYALKLVEGLLKKGINAQLCIYGEGPQKTVLEKYIESNGLEDCIFLLGNKTSEALKGAYQDSHFLLLPSKSEGWPKVVAEAMFWGCLPVATSVSCVPYMLDFGERGILLDLRVEEDCKKIENYLNNNERYDIQVEKAAEWSKKYTLDFFEKEIQLLLLR